MNRWQGFSGHTVYVDEAGDHSLESINPTFPVFVLAFCVVRKKDYAGQIVPAVTRLKFKHFGHDQVVLHEREIRKATGAFRGLFDPEKRAAFWIDLNQLMREAPFTLIAAVIDKARLAATYNVPESPYDLALKFCMERLQMHLRPLRKIHVVVESRGRKEDAELELAFRRICDGQNQLNERLDFDVVFADKKANSSGLQFADLVARPIGRHVMKPKQPNRAWDIIQVKLRRSPAGRVEGWGLKCFP